ncbi:MAG: hypothetical protein U1F43_18895 [Myxococcota bacterium]
MPSRTVHRPQWLGLALLLAHAACDGGDDPAPSDATTDATDASALDTTVALDMTVALDTTAALDTTGPDASDAVTPAHGFGLNDLTVLLPMPNASTPSLLAPDTLVPSAVWQRLVADPGDVLADFATLHVVAVRFDLCDRTATTPCPPGADGRLRLVAQPMFGGTPDPQFADTAVHAFYPIPAAELPGVIAELRRLAVLQDAPTSPLQVNEALSDPTSPYALGLTALVARFAKAERLVRLTLFSQISISAAFRWVFRGEERPTPADAFVAMVIPDLGETSEEVLLVGDQSYEVTPAVDLPKGFALTLSASAFAAASLDDQRAALGVLEAIDDPRVHAPDTVQCLGCHVASILLPARGSAAHLDLAALDRFRAADESLDLTPLAFPGAGDRTLRALGYSGFLPIISARVVHETALVLAEVEARFPPDDAP